MTLKIWKNPFRPGDTVNIPIGTPYRYRGEQGFSKRPQTVKVHHGFDAYYNDRYDSHKMEITIPGSGGYWKDYEVTQEMLDFNNAVAVEVR